MLSTLFGFLAGTCAVLALFLIPFVLLGLVVAAMRPRLDPAPAAGCAAVALCLAVWAVMLAWLSSALR